MERRLQWGANAYKGQCNEQRGPKATLPELASMKKNSRLSSDRSGVPYTGVKILPKLWEKVWMRRGGDPNRNMLPLVQSTTWRSEVVIAKVILTARAQRLRANEADEGPGAKS